MHHPELTPLKDAQKQLFEQAYANRKLSSLQVSVEAAFGQVTAEDIYASHALPPTDVSAVDGYAVNSAQLAADPNFAFQIVGEAKAGHPFSGQITPEQAIRIYTGAVMPDGPDCVIMHEDCQFDAAQVIAQIPGKTGMNVRPKGENLANGEKLMGAGQTVTPAAIGQLNAAGISEIHTYAPLQASILSMGDEIIQAGKMLAAGQIYDSNRPMLSALLAAENITAIDGGIIADDKAALVNAYRKGLASCDVVISSAGASDGIEDHTQAALQELGAEILFWRVAIKPGRPISVARLGHQFIFCLPGNPVAVYVCFLLLVKPVLAILSGGDPAQEKEYHFPCDFAYNKKKGRTEFVRVVIRTDEQGTQRAFLHGRKGAGVISSLLGADGVIEIPAGAEKIERGTVLKFIPFPHER